jgi:hypothetical protein
VILLLPGGAEVHLPTGNFGQIVRLVLRSLVVVSWLPFSGWILAPTHTQTVGEFVPSATAC